MIPFLRHLAAPILPSVKNEAECREDNGNASPV